MIFVDTGAWFAFLVPADPNHRAAYRWLSENQDDLLTTDYVVDETLTLLRARGEHQRANQFGGLIFSDEVADLYVATRTEVVAAWDVFRRFDDKE